MEKITKLVDAAVLTVVGEAVEHDIERPVDESHGDYSTNAALKLAKKVSQNPKELAQKIADELKNNSEIDRAEVAGPGFVNIFVTSQQLHKQMARAGSFKPSSLSGKTVVVEYSDPNPFKVLHAGHLYTTIVGDSIASLFEAAGANVHRLNYGGDVGLHVGKAMWAIIEFLGGEKPENLDEVDEQKRPSWLSQRYVEGNSAYEENDQAKKEIIEINKRVYKLHNDNDHESNFAQIYWACRQWSYDGFDELYSQLKVSPFEKYIPESEVAPEGLSISKSALNKGVLEKSEGAIVYKGEGKGMHTRVFINSAGLPTYEAKDLGLAARKWQDYEFDINLIITANDIQQYMKIVLEVLSNFYPEASVRTKHLTHGIVKLSGGRKMSSRLGNVLLAEDILNAARKASNESEHDYRETTVLAAVKYAFIKQRIGGDVIYEPEESVSIQGNSGPYLQYSHARAHSILENAKAERDDEQNFDPEERKLAKKISEYPEIFEKALNDCMPHHVANYLFELAQSFNRFYERNRVVGSQRETVRAGILDAYVGVLKNGLKILGIEAPEKL